MIELAIFVGILLTGIPIAVYRSIRKMAAAPRLDLKPELVPVITNPVNRKVGAFLAVHGFTFANAYQFHGIRFGHWMHNSNRPPLRNLTAYVGPASLAYEFVTEFSDEHSLTTSQTKAGFMYPRPFGSFLQAFPKASIEELLDLHIRGEQHLISTLSIPIKEIRAPLLERFTSGILRQIRYIKSHSLWPIRGIYWYLIRRYVMRNRPIWKQNIPKVYRQVD